VFRVLLAFVRAEIPLETLEGGQELGELGADFAFDAEEKGPECQRVVARVFDVLPKGEWLDPAIEHQHEELERFGAARSDRGHVSLESIFEAVEDEELTQRHVRAQPRARIRE
jgi:hypothetical protein